MRLHLLAVALVLFAASASAQKKTVTVAADGSGDFRDIQAAVDSAPAGNLSLRIRPGTYRQVVHITAPGIELHGLGRQPQEVVLTFDNSHTMAGGTGASASTTVSGDDFLAENLTFENSWERERGEKTPTQKEGSQAVALLVTGDREVFRHVRLLGAQDTLYANSKTCHSAEEIAAAQPCRAARQYFSDCYIEGHVDFIFGDAKAVFDHCEIHAVAHPVVTITAQSRVYPAEDSGYLFRDCTITGDAGAPNVLLGRPWRPYSTVVFLNTSFKTKLNPEGWAEWDGKLKTSSYSEYGSTGQAGDLKQRLAPAKILTRQEAAALTTQSWLAGPDHWNPTR